MNLFKKRLLKRILAIVLVITTFSTTITIEKAKKPMQVHLRVIQQSISKMTQKKAGLVMTEPLFSWLITRMDMIITL